MFVFCHTFEQLFLPPNTCGDRLVFHHIPQFCRLFFSSPLLLREAGGYVPTPTGLVPLSIPAIYALAKLGEPKKPSPPCRGQYIEGERGVNRISRGGDLFLVQAGSKA